MTEDATEITREEYLRIRETKGIIYEYYKIFFDPNKYKHFLNYDEFFHYLSQLVGIEAGYIVARDHFDQKFNVMTVTDLKTKQTIRVL